MRTPLEEVELDVQKLYHLNLKLADNFPRKTATVDLLVGIDQYYSLVQDKIKRGVLVLQLLQNKLGWLLSGPIHGQVSKSNQTVAILSVSGIEDPHSVLKRFWELDAIGLIDNLGDSKYTAKEEFAVEQFERNVEYDGKRFTVGLPWKKNSSPLDNPQQAMQRLVSIEKSLK